MRKIAGWVGGWPLFVYGWREVFVPLVVLFHNEHGPSLAVAALAVAATRLGGWLVHKTSRRRPLPEASLLCGVALLFLGIAPEEGPISLLLWFLFGLGWPALHASLAARLWTGWAGLAALLVGMVLAGPLVRGPGAWVIAAGCLLLACTPAPAGEFLPQGDMAVDGRGRWAPLLFSAVYLVWVWLLPLRLGQTVLEAELFAGVMAAGWLARSLSAQAVDRGAIPPPVRVMSALLLAPAAAAVALASTPALVALAGVVFGALLGVASFPAAARRWASGWARCWARVWCWRPVRTQCSRPPRWRLSRWPGHCSGAKRGRRSRKSAVRGRRVI